jgi:hypothetical protein
MQSERLGELTDAYVRVLISLWIFLFPNLRNNQKNFS